MRRICAPIVLVVTALCTLLPAGLASAAILTVCPKGGCDYTTIQDAINASSSGDVILVYEGTYTGNGDSVIDLNSGQNIHIFANDGPENTIIDGEGQRRGVYVWGNGSSVLEGFTITNCHAMNSPRSHGRAGSGMYADGFTRLVVENCIFSENNSVSFGGGFYGEESEVSFYDCAFLNNIAEYGGGAYSAGWGAPGINLFDNCVFENNQAHRGGGVYAAYYTYILNCTFSANEASSSGSGRGGGLYGHSSWNAPVVADTYFCLNTPDDIGGYYNDWGGNTFGASCACPDGPCVIYVPGDYPTIQDAIDNAGNGDIIEISPGTYHENLNFHPRGNLSLRPYARRGGVSIDGGGHDRVMNMNGSSSYFDVHHIEIDGITITNGVTPENDIFGGGGVYVGGHFVTDFTNCTITNNRSLTDGFGTSGDGGGVMVDTSFEMPKNTSFYNCVINNNTASGNGGGIHFDTMFSNMNDCGSSNNNGSSVIIYNCVISENVAEEGSGGGVYVNRSYFSLSVNENGSLPTTNAFEDCVISNNAARLGGGISIDSNWNNCRSSINYNGCGTNNNGMVLPLTLQNCSIVDNTAADKGGGMFLGEPASSFYPNLILIQSGSCSGNQSTRGGGIYGSPYCQIELTSPLIEGNHAAYYGGALYLSEVYDFGVSETLFLDNATSGFGGAIYVSTGEVHLGDSQFLENSAYEGGAIFAFETISYISGSDFEENDASNVGGAIYNLVSMSEIDTSIFCSNTPDDIAGPWIDEGDVVFEEICGSPATCLGDTNADYNVDVLDLLYVILVWNSDNSQADFNEDGFVDVMDLLQVIANWGICA